MDSSGMSRLVLSIVIVAIVAIGGVAYWMLSNNPGTSGSQGSQPIRISGAGSTFVTYFLQTAAYYYQQKYGVEVDYASIGSGAGIQQFLANAVDFGATDVPLSTQAWQQAGDALHIPEAIGGVVLTYNIPDLPPNTHLNFTGEVIADIYLGKITKWNDPALVKLNPILANINQPITTVHRSDGSGT